MLGLQPTYLGIILQGPGPGLGACLFLCPPGVSAGGAMAKQVWQGKGCFFIILGPKPVRWRACLFLCPEGVSAGGVKRRHFIHRIVLPWVPMKKGHFSQFIPDWLHFIFQSGHFIPHWLHSMDEIAHTMFSGPAACQSDPDFPSSDSSSVAQDCKAGNDYKIHVLFFPTCQVRVVRFYVNSRASFSASSPDLNYDDHSRVFAAGPQPRPAMPSVRCRTSTTTSHAQCSLPDLNHDQPRPVFAAGPQPRPDRMPDRMSEDTPDRMPDRMSEDMTDRMSDRMPDRMSEDMANRMSEDMTDRISEDMIDRMSEDMPDRMSEDMPDRISEDMTDRMSEDIQTECQKICQIECQKIYMPDKTSEDMPDRYAR